MPEYIVALLIVINLLPFGTGTKESFENKITSKYPIVKSETANKVPEISKLLVPIQKSDEVFAATEANISVDLNSGRVIYANQEKKKTQIASLTKLMTAYVILKESKLEEVIIIPNITNQVSDSVMGISTGEKLDTKTVLKGLLINSGNDAAQALAINNAGSIEKFVIKMNNAAQALNLNDTHFTNPVGWDDPSNYSTAADIATLARILLRNKDFAEIVRTKSEIVYTKEGRAISLESTNKLLGMEGIAGVKTGYTLVAGECLVTLYSKDNREILTVILNSNDRFGVTTNFLDWIFRQFSW